MIRFSNGHEFEYMVASGALAFDGFGWPWERPLVKCGIIKPELFTVVAKTITRNPRKGNLKMWKPWSSIQILDEHSAVNKVGLTNPGFDWWYRTIGPTVSRKKLALVASIFGSRSELVEMATSLNDVALVGLEVNASCPNTGHPLGDIESVVDDVRAVKSVSRHPLIIKVSVAQDYCAIVQRLEDTVEAVALNSVPWEIVYPPNRPRQSPLWRLEKVVGGGGGGVSGTYAKKHNWLAVNQLREHTHVPIIGPSVMEYEDLAKVRRAGASAISFGAIHLLTPWKPTAIVRKELSHGQN